MRFRLLVRMYPFFSEPFEWAMAYEMKRRALLMAAEEPKEHFVDSELSETPKQAQQGELESEGNGQKFENASPSRTEREPQ